MGEVCTRPKETSEMTERSEWFFNLVDKKDLVALRTVKVLRL